MGGVLGIDLGTSNTAAAVWDGGRPAQVVRLSPDTDQMPSGVWIGDDGGLVTGQAAARGAVSMPERYERSPKSRIGEPAVLLGEQDVPVAQLLAAVLRTVTATARRWAGGSAPDRTVLTHPAQWGPARLEVVREAARLAELGPVELMPEPVAAASWYLRQDQQGVPIGASVGVFDFGGGTCDVAILRAGHQGLEILASDGEDWLGGEHLDQKLLDEVRRRLQDRGENDLVARVDADEAAYLALRDQVRGAKHTLSEYESAHIAVRAGDATATVLLTRPEFDALIRPDIDRAVELVRRVVQAAGITPDALARFYLVGGSSAIPLVQRLLHELLGRPVATLSDPKTVVALGATQQAPRPNGVSTPPQPMAAPPPPMAPPLPTPPPGPYPPPHQPYGPVPAKSSAGKKVLVGVGIVAALGLVGGGIAFGVSQGGGGGDDPSSSSSSSAPEPPPDSSEEPPPALPPVDLASVFPDLNAEETACEEYFPGPDEFTLDSGSQPEVIWSCLSPGNPTVTVYYARWTGTATPSQWLGELRAKFGALDNFTTWSVDEVVQGPYLAGQFTGNVQIHGAYNSQPYSFTIVGNTLDEVNAAYSAISFTAAP